jgi:uncharacterized protein (DUF2252 family)
VAPAQRAAVLEAARVEKMAQSANRFVRGSTAGFYDWIAAHPDAGIPEGPPVWICGDCHVGNLGPTADVDGRVRIHIRDLDQTVIGNPALDLVRLALSLASASRGSDLPGVTTAHVLEAIMDGYASAFIEEVADTPDTPDSVRLVMRQAAKRTWKHLARERIEDVRPDIPLGKKFWPVTRSERDGLGQLFDDHDIARLATMVKGRDDGASVEVIDSAYWMKGCSSLGLLRYAVLLEVTDEDGKDSDFCLMDIKEAESSLAPGADLVMPDDQAQRVVEGARHLSPYLGERMRATSLLGHSVFVRELLPQDLKLELTRLTTKEAMRAAAFLAAVVGVAHAGQMDGGTRTAWQAELRRGRRGDLDAPSWLWSAVVGLVVDHERSYLEHCRRYALAAEG